MNAHIGSFEATIKAEAKARRIRLMGVTKPVNYKPEPAHVVTWARPYSRPIAQEDAHVRTWKWYQANKTEVDRIISLSLNDGNIVIATAKESMASICHRVIKEMGNEASLGEILGHRRDRYLCNIRQKCYYEVKKLRPDLTFPSIARFFNRDHSTILTTVKKLHANGWRGL